MKTVDRSYKAHYGYGWEVWWALCQCQRSGDLWLVLPLLLLHLLLRLCVFWCHPLSTNSARTVTVNSINRRQLTAVECLFGGDRSILLLRRQPFTHTPPHCLADWFDSTTADGVAKLGLLSEFEEWEATVSANWKFTSLCHREGRGGVCSLRR